MKGSHQKIVRLHSVQQDWLKLFGTMNKDIINNEITNLSGTRCSDVEIKAAKIKIQQVIGGEKPADEINTSVVKVKGNVK